MSVTVPADLRHLATMTWSFMGGTSSAGWLRQDEDKWDEAIEILMKEYKKGKGFKELDGVGCKLGFIADIAIATK